jgi:type IV secretion system protein VirD4
MKAKLIAAATFAAIVAAVDHGVPLLMAMLALGLVAVVFLCLRLRRFVPRNRTRTMRYRLHLRMRPGRGFATVAELWLRWGRFAAWRRSPWIRPSLGSWHRLTHPDEHSVILGRAQLGHALRSSREEHVIITAEPRTGKSRLLSAMLIKQPGPAVVTESKIGVYQDSSAIRAKRGPVEILNPANLGGVQSTIRFNPIEGAHDPQVAIRRADAFAQAISLKGTENGDYFAGKCSAYLRALFAAAALVGGDLRLVSRWASGSAEQAEHILQEAGYDQWAQELAELRGPAEKSAATTKSVMTMALNWLNDPELAKAVLPGAFDIDALLRANGTLYMIASQQGENSPLAPLFACLASEVMWTASVIGSKMPGARLDPPLAMYLDEVTQVCPLPLPSILSDAGGRGIQVVSVVHGFSALADKYGDHGAQTVMNTSGVKIWLGGSSEIKTLEMISRLAGDFQQRLRYQDHHTEHKVITEGMARALPPGYAVVLRGSNAPVIGRLQSIHRQPEYKRARRNGGTMADLQPAAEVAVVDHLAIEKPHEVVASQVDAFDWAER